MSTTTVAISKPCGYCGGYHTAMCPRIKSIEYHNDGTVKRVELHGPWPQFPTPVPFPQEPSSGGAS